MLWPVMMFSTHGLTGSAVALEGGREGTCQRPRVDRVQPDDGGAHAEPVGCAVIDGQPEAGLSAVDAEAPGRSGRPRRRFRAEEHEVQHPGRGGCSLCRGLGKYKRVKNLSSKYIVPLVKKVSFSSSREASASP